MTSPYFGGTPDDVPPAAADRGPEVSLYRQKSSEEAAEARNALIEVLALAADPNAACQHAARDTLDTLQAEAASWLLLALLEIVGMRTQTPLKSSHPFLTDALVHKAAVMAAATWDAGKPGTLTVSMDEMAAWLQRIVDSEVNAVDPAASEVPEPLSDALELVSVGLNGFTTHDATVPAGVMDAVQRVIHHASLETVPLVVRAALLEALALPLQNTAAMQFTAAAPNAPQVLGMAKSLRLIVDRCVADAEAVEKAAEHESDAVKTRRLADIGRVADKAALAMYHMSRTAFVDGDGIAQRYMKSLAAATFMSHEAGEAVGAVSEGGVVPPPKEMRAVVAALLASAKRLQSVTGKPADEAAEPHAYQLQRAQLNAAWALGKVITMSPEIVMKTKGLSTSIVDLCLHTFCVFGTNIESAASASQVAAIESRMHTLNVLDQVMRALPPAMGRRKLKQAILDASSRGDADKDYRWHAASMIALMYGAEGCREELADDTDIERIVLQNLYDREGHPLTRFYALRCLSEIPIAFIARNIVAILAVAADELKSLKDGRKPAADFTTWNSVELTSHLVSSIVSKYEELMEHQAEDAKDSEDDDMNFGENRMSVDQAAAVVQGMERIKHEGSGFKDIVKGTIELVSSPNPFVSVSAAQAVRNLVAVPIDEETACGFVDGMLVFVESWIKRDEGLERAASSSFQDAESSIFDLCGRHVATDAKLRSDYRWMARGGQTAGAVLTGAHNAFVNLLGDGSTRPSDRLFAQLDRFIGCVRSLLESRRGREIGSPIAAATILATRGLLRMPKGITPPLSLMPKIIDTALNGVGCPEPAPVSEDTYPLHMRGAEDLEREIVIVNGRQVSLVADPEQKNFETYIETCANLVMDIAKFSVREGVTGPLQRYIHDFAMAPSMLLARSPNFTGRAAGHLPSVINELALTMPGTMCNFVQALMVRTMWTPPGDDDVAEEEAAFCAQSLGTIVESVPDLLRFYHALGQARGVQHLLIATRRRMSQALDRSMTITQALKRIEARLSKAESDDGGGDDDAASDKSGSESDPEGVALEESLEQLRGKLHDTDICASRLPALYGVCLRMADFLVEKTRPMEVIAHDAINQYPVHTLDREHPSDTAVTASLNSLWWCNKHLPLNLPSIAVYLDDYNKLICRFCDQMMRAEDTDMGQSLFSSLNELLQRMVQIYTSDEFHKLVVEPRVFAAFLKKAIAYLMSPLAAPANSNSATANATSLLLTAIIVCPDSVFDDITPAAVGMAFATLEQNMPIKGDAGEAIWVYARLTHWFTRGDFGVMAHVPWELQLKMARKIGRSKHARAPLKKVLDDTILSGGPTMFVTPKTESRDETLAYVLFGANPGVASSDAIPATPAAGNATAAAGGSGQKAAAAEEEKETAADDGVPKKTHRTE